MPDVPQVLLVKFDVRRVEKLSQFINKGMLPIMRILSGKALPRKSEMAIFIHAGLQPGDGRSKKLGNRFNGFLPCDS